MAKAKPASAAVAAVKTGVTTSKEFSGVMSALMVDLLNGRVTPQVGNAVCNAGGKLLKIVELQHKYGTPTGQQGESKVLQLSE
jgi:hypothetical protein